jgi:hypothetical protein
LRRRILGKGRKDVMFSYQLYMASVLLVSSFSFFWYAYLSFFFVTRIVLRGSKADATENKKKCRPQHELNHRLKMFFALQQYLFFDNVSDRRKVEPLFPPMIALCLVVVSKSVVVSEAIHPCVFLLFFFSAPSTQCLYHQLLLITCVDGATQPTRFALGYFFFLAHIICFSAKCRYHKNVP